VTRGYNVGVREPALSALSAAADADLREQIRGAGLRVTAPRVAVLRLLRDAGGPVSHAEVAERLIDQGWDRATLYRNLTDLADAGVLSRADLGDHVWRYALAEAGAGAHTGAHPHFLCTTCGDVSCLPELAVPDDAPLPASVRAGRVEIQVRGVCDRCDEVVG
jgi:Fur family ferric uptake transcriptional regulator